MLIARPLPRLVPPPRVEAKSDLEVLELSLPGLRLVRPKVFTDDRGYFFESWSDRRLEGAGIHETWVQDNHSRSTRHTIRGLHFQHPTATSPGQAKLVRCARGTIWDVVVDIRPDSPTYRRWLGVTLDDQKNEQLYVPAGFAHGFCVLSAEADVTYKVSTYYDASIETGFSWADPSIGITWPVSAAEAVLSARDLAARPLDLVAHP